MRHVACGMWHAACDIRCDRWHVTSDMRHVVRCVASGVWQVTGGTLLVLDGDMRVECAM